MGAHTHADILIDLGTATEKSEKGQVLEKYFQGAPRRGWAAAARCHDTGRGQKRLLALHSDNKLFQSTMFAGRLIFLSRPGFTSLTSLVEKGTGQV